MKFPTNRSWLFQAFILWTMLLFAGLASIVLMVLAFHYRDIRIAAAAIVQSGGLIAFFMTGAQS